MNCENEPLPSFEHLPTEILLQIFGFLSLRDLVTTFSDLNFYIKSIIQLIRDANHVVRCNDTDGINLLQLFPTQIRRLLIVNVESIDFTSLNNLRSLTLKYGTHAQFDSIRPQYLPMLEILYIKGLHATVNVGAESINNLFEVILSNGFPRLRKCTAFHIGCFEFCNRWTGSPTLHTLNLHLKTTSDSEQLCSVCPRLRQLTTYDSSMGNPLEVHSRTVYKCIHRELLLLEQLEAENKFIIHDNPIERFAIIKPPSRFNNTIAVQPSDGEYLLTFQGRILLQTEPYCRASFLIEIKLPAEYPFKVPRITFLDPIYHPNFRESGRHCCCSSIGFDELYKPTTRLTEIIECVIRTVGKVNNYCDAANSLECSNEYRSNKETFYKKALEHSLSYGRPRY